MAQQTARSRKNARKRLTDLMVEEGIITEEQKQRALVHQKQAKLLITDALLDLRFISQDDIAIILIRALSAPYIDINQYKVNKDAIHLFPEKMCREYQFFPLDIIGDVVIVAAGAFMNQDIRNELSHVSGRPVQVFISKIGDIYAYIDKHYEAENAQSGSLTSLGNLLLDENL